MRRAGVQRDKAGQGNRSHSAQGVIRNLGFILRAVGSLSRFFSKELENQICSFGNMTLGESR